MDKKIIYCVFIYIAIGFQNILGQSFMDRNEGLWISDENYIIFIDSTKGSVYTPKGKYRGYLKTDFKSHDSLVIFADNFKSYDYDFNQKPSKTIVLKLLEMDCHTLKLIPENDFSKEFLGTTNMISFSRTNKLLHDNKNIGFEKLLFYGQEDFFNYYLQIDNERNIKMIKEYNGRKSNTSIIFYYGQMEKYFFTLLIEKIKMANLKNLEYKIIMDCGSCDQKSLIVEFRNRTFKYENFGISPIIIEDIVEYIKSFSNTVKLKESKEKFDFNKYFK